MDSLHLSVMPDVNIIGVKGEYKIHTIVRITTQYIKFKNLIMTKHCET